MNPVNDQILEQALSQLRSGEEILVIAKQFPQSEIELIEMLQTIELLSSIPTKTPPTPMKQRKFAERKTATWSLLGYLNTIKYATIPIILAIAFLGSNTLIQATEGSLPGEVLFSLKKATEKAHISLTFNEEKTASLKLAITQKRLNEAKIVLAEKLGPEKEALALKELTKQTEDTFESVAQVAASSALTKNDSTLLNSLVAINKEQKDLLTDKPEEENQVLASLTEENGRTIAKLVSAVNEQSLSNIPNRISISGAVKSFKFNLLTVEANTFTINESTIILNNQGEISSSSNINGKVTVIGSIDNNILLAKKIILIEPSLTPDTKPVVKGATTPKPTPATPPALPKEEPSVIDEPIQSPQQPSEVTSGFIIEPTSKQYTQ